MAIGFRKLSELIDSEVSLLSELDEEQRRLLADLCRKVYMHGVSASSGVSPQKIREKVKQDIIGIADRLTG